MTKGHNWHIYEYDNYETIMDTERATSERSNIKQKLRGQCVLDKHASNRNDVFLLVRSIQSQTKHTDAHHNLR